MRPQLRRTVGIAVIVLIAAGSVFAAAIWRFRRPTPARAAGADLAAPSGRPRLVHDHALDPPAKHKGNVSVDSGLYVREDDDVVLSRGQTFRFTRTYLSGYHAHRAFRIGTTSNAEWYLSGDLNDLNAVNLILPAGTRIRFDRVSGTAYDNSLWTHDSTPTAFVGAMLGWTGRDWALRFENDGFARFLPCDPGSKRECLLTELHDQDGHALVFTRDAPGTLLRIEGEDSHISFAYDAQRRIVRITSPEGQIDYDYDGQGRLVRVRETDGAERRYTYDERDQMLTIDEPGWFIENTWNQGRVIKQVTLIPGSPFDGRRQTRSSIAFRYTVTDGRVTQNDVTEYDGTHTVLRFNPAGYVTDEVDDADSVNPIRVTISRDPVSMRAETVTVACLRRGHRVTGSASVHDDQEETKRMLTYEYCRPPRASIALRPQIPS